MTDNDDWHAFIFEKVANKEKNDVLMGMSFWDRLIHFEKILELQAFEQLTLEYLTSMNNTINKFIRYLFGVSEFKELEDQLKPL